MLMHVQEWPFHCCVKKTKHNSRKRHREFDFNHFRIVFAIRNPVSVPDSFIII